MKHKKIKYLTLIEKKNKLLSQIAPLLERFTASTGMIVTKIEAEPKEEVVRDERFEEPKVKEIKITYNLNAEIKL